MNERSDEDPREAETPDLEGELISRLELIESQPLDRRAEGFDQLTEELLAELQRSDRDTSAET